MKKVNFLFILWLAIAGWSCQSSNFEDLENDSILSSELDPIDDLPYRLFALRSHVEPFMMAVAIIYRDDLGKKLFRLLETQLGKGAIILKSNPELGLWMILKTDIATLEYGEVRGDEDILANLTYHELFHIYQCHVDFGLEAKKLKHICFNLDIIQDALYLCLVNSIKYGTL